MSDNCAICSIALGAKAQMAIETLQSSITHCLPPNIHIPFIRYTRTRKDLGTNIQHSRHAKLTMFDWVDERYILYLDADTVVKNSGVLVGFDILRDGFDLVITPSKNQDRDFMCHTTPDDIIYTKKSLGYIPTLQLQGGVFWIARNERTQQLFSIWLKEWLVFQNQDQGALLRALRQVPLKIWLLGRPFNGIGSRTPNAVVDHHFGHAV